MLPLKSLLRLLVLLLTPPLRPLVLLLKQPRLFKLLPASKRFLPILAEKKSRLQAGFFHGRVNHVPWFVLERLPAETVRLCGHQNFRRRRPQYCRQRGRRQRR
ncbi:hypothetical protein PTE30175_02737 [Pandoraea terrae]|uniref:Uncharacterized protein n=1 Tax=Pandoraea terrae TaxID=1537710 RepID=A0A5E4VRW1_9BURK|nr:hypothetical protein PTE30175_02737 [Pandoraea terrae]